MAGDKRRSTGDYVSFHKASGLYQAKVPTDQRDERGRIVYRYAYAKTKAEAVRLRRQIERAVEENALPDPNRLTVAQFLDQWYDQKAPGLAEGTKEIYEYYLRKYIKPRVGHLPLTKLTPLDVAKMQTDLIVNVGPPTAAKARAVLSSALNTARRWRLVGYNPVEATDAVVVEEREETVWEQEHAVGFLEHLARHPRDFALIPIVSLALATGMRRSELLGVRWKDLKVEAGPDGERRGLISIRQTVTAKLNGGYRINQRPKTKRSKRPVVLDGETLEVLENHRRRQEARRAERGEAAPDHDLIFPSPEGLVWCPHNFYRTWRECLEEADVPDIRIHDLRHTYITLAIHNGVDVLLIADRVGHADPGFMLRRYGHVLRAQRAAGAVPLSSLLGRAPGAPRPEA